MTEKLIDENKGAVKRTGRKGQSEYRKKSVRLYATMPIYFN